MKKPVALPNLTPRKAEVEAIVEIITDEVYDTPEAMAKAVLKEAYKQFQGRDWWVAGYQGALGRIGTDEEPDLTTPHRVPVLYGPYPTDAAALKALNGAAGGSGGDVAGIFKVTAINTALKAEELVAPEDTRLYCPRCLHETTRHLKVRGRWQCVTYKCDCHEAFY